jgi:phage terminase large subunit GpA-like protein
MVEWVLPRGYEAGMCAWAHIVWPEDDPSRAAFACPHCKETIDEQHKTTMVTAGRWRAMRPEVKGHAGFRLNALVSLLANASWGRLAREFIACKDDAAELQVFHNTVLALGWSSPAMVDESALAARAEDFDLERIPAEVLFLTAGVDVGDDRLECSVVGWTRTNVCLVLAHYTIWGSFNDAGTWDELDELLRTRWRHPYGGKLGVDATVVDCGDGDHYDTVLNFCVPKMRRRVFAGKGLFGARPGFQMAKGKTIANRLALIGVDTIKNIVFDRLQRGQAIRFSKSLEPIYYEQLCAERRVIRYSHGQPLRRFERTGRVRAEALDCLTYAHAVRAVVQISPDRREAELHGTALPTPSLASRLAR